MDDLKLYCKFWCLFAYGDGKVKCNEEKLRNFSEKILIEVNTELSGFLKAAKTYQEGFV